MNWQPIETAPRDGRRVLLCYPSGAVECGRWNDDRYARKPRPFWEGDQRRLFGVGVYRAASPKHWMPIPEPPEAV
jgi:hypothetical protein